MNEARDFYITFAQVSATILSVMLAFYGVFIAYIGQQAMDCRREINEDLQRIDAGVRSFSNFTHPRVGGQNWNASREQGNRASLIIEKESWTQSPGEALDLIIQSVANSSIEASREDQEIMDYLKTKNATHLLANYLVVGFHLDNLIYSLCAEFPSPKELAAFSPWHVDKFISSDFPSNDMAFRHWSERYCLFSEYVSTIRYQIGASLQNVSCAYLDAARIGSQELQELTMTNASQLVIRSKQETIQYNIDMSRYYDNGLVLLASISDEVVAARQMILKYNVCSGLARYDILPPVVAMAISGVGAPMALIVFHDRLTEASVLRRVRNIPVPTVVMLLSAIVYVWSVFAVVNLIRQVLDQLYFS